MNRPSNGLHNIESVLIGCGIKPMTVSGKRHAKSPLFGVAFDQPDSNSESL